MLWALIVFLSVSVILPAAGLASVDRAPLAVSMTITDGGVTVGTPEIVLSHGIPAVVTINREGGYSMRAVARVTEDSTIHLDTEIHLKEAGKWVPAARPQFRVGMGAPARVVVQRRSAPAGRDPAFMVEVLVDNWAGVLGSRGGNPCSPQVATRSGWIEMLQTLVERLPAWEGAVLPVQACCETGCVSCCGSRACCSDPWNCPRGCCTS